MTHIKLYGEMADAVGQSEWYLEISTPSELFRAIEANTGRMFTFLYEKAKELPYRFIVNDRPLKTIEEFAYLNTKLEKIEVVPILGGAGMDGIWLILVGVVILAVSIFVPVFGPSLYTVWGSAATATIATTTLFTIGLAVTLSGLSQLLTPGPVEDKERPEDKPSYIYDGAVNTLRQGNPVPTGFGFLGIGSQVISAGLRSIDVDSTETTV